MPPILRSRQILPPNSTSSSPRHAPKNSAPTTTKASRKGNSSIEPLTPNRTIEASALSLEQTPDNLPPQSDSGPHSAPLPCRRSRRLSGKSNCGRYDELVVPGRQRRRTGSSLSSGKSEPVLNTAEFYRAEESEALGVGLMEIIRVSDSESDETNGDDMVEFQGVVGSEGSGKKGKKGSKRKLSDPLDVGVDLEAESPDGTGFLSLRLGTKSAKTRCDDFAGEGGAKGKEIVLDSDEESDGKMDDYQSAVRLMGLKFKRKFSRDEKGKGILLCDDEQLLNRSASVDLNLKLGLDSVNLNVSEQPNLNVSEPTPTPVLDNANSPVNVNPQVLAEDDNLQPPPADNVQEPSSNDRTREYRLRQYREIAKETASRFARVTPTHVLSESDEEGEEAPGQDAAQNLEEWPGPFSTAMKIIRDREKKNYTRKTFASTKSASVLWKPRSEAVCLKNRVAPSLKDLCLNVLAKNSDAISSLEYVPDAMRNKLTRMLCDSRTMTGQVLDLLLEGSPSEIRVADCSWITEEQFAKSIESCNTDGLMVLDLNQCGRCMPDYTLNETLVRKGLPALTTISLKGACRLSDNGLTQLILKAPSLRSINLSQCSLLTDVGICAIAESLGSVLRELYLDDCQSLNSMLILPALQKMNHLEVLSLAGIPSVSNVFVKELVNSNGRGLKELVLADCTKLTDKSLKVIGETCSGLCTLDLQKVTKLSDSGIGYITNGCPSIQKLKLCRQTFSDEAVAAFVETRGQSLTELCLNGVLKVGVETAISIGKNCKSLLSLDVSFCRDLTDEHLGLIADSCLSLRVMKAFGCQMTYVFLNGHSNPHLHVIGAKMTAILEHMRLEDLLPGY